MHLPSANIVSTSLNVQDLFQVKSSNYRPPTVQQFPMDWLGLPPFTIREIEAMRRDSQVKLGMAIKNAPLLKPRFQIEGDPVVVEFVKKTLQSFWTSAVPRVLNGLWYTRAAMEVIYQRKDDGLVHFHRVRPFYPSDVTILTRHGEKFGVRVKAQRLGENASEGEQNAGAADENSKQNHGCIDLLGPKSFLYVHRREFGSWDGQSEFEAAYEPWLEKRGRDGAKAIRKLWMYKNAYNSGIIFHPPGNYIFNDPATGDQLSIPYADLARQAVELAATGAVWAFPQEFDDSGNPLWSYQPPQMHGEASGLIDYVDKLDIEILHGLGIPDDIISQVGGTGSYAGRTIPLMAFFVSQTEIIRQIASDFREQVLDWLVALNFDSNDFEIVQVGVNTDELMPETPSAKGGAQSENQGVRLVDASKLSPDQQQYQQTQMSNIQIEAFDYRIDENIKKVFGLRDAPDGIQSLRNGRVLLTMSI